MNLCCNLLCEGSLLLSTLELKALSLHGIESAPTLHMPCVVLSLLVLYGALVTLAFLSLEFGIRVCL